MFHSLSKQIVIANGHLHFSLHLQICRFLSMPPFRQLLELGVCCCHLHWILQIKQQAKLLSLFFLVHVICHAISTKLLQMLLNFYLPYLQCNCWAALRCLFPSSTQFSFNLVRLIKIIKEMLNMLTGKRKHVTQWHLDLYIHIISFQNKETFNFSPLSLLLPLGTDFNKETFIPFVTENFVDFFPCGD